MEFYRYRNGIVAQNLRQIYGPDTMVFGLNLPQLSEIAALHGKDKELGKKLWEEYKSREDRLIALYVLPPDELDKDEVKSMIEDIRNNEQAEMLAFRLLRHLPYAHDLYEELTKTDNLSPAARYGVVMLGKNLGL